MPNEIVMPRLSEGMTEAYIISWEKKAGDQVEPGEILAILETDGQQIKLPSFVSGTLKIILCEAGAKIPVGVVIALMGIKHGDQPGADIQPILKVEPEPERTAITQQICQAWQSAPHFAVSVHIEMEAVESLCRAFREEGVRISANDFIIKACVAALLKFPQVNSSYSDKGSIRHRRINIGIALSLQHGAVTPVLRECNGKSIHEIAREIRILMERARKGILEPHETTGGTFTVANLGMYGVDAFLTIVRSPEAAVLALGAIRNAPIVVEGKVIPGRLMTATLSSDHRLLDGADAGLFMAELRRVLEHPTPVLFNDSDAK